MSPPSPMKRTTKRAGNVFDMFGTQRSLMPKGEQARPILKNPIKNDEPEISALRKCIIDLEAQHKGTIEEYFTNCHSPFIEDILALPLPDKLKMPQLKGYERERDPLSHLNKYTSWMEL